MSESLETQAKASTASLGSLASDDMGEQDLMQYDKDVDEARSRQNRTYPGWSEKSGQRLRIIAALEHKGHDVKLPSSLMA
ncbi:MAG: hypothetical protein Q9185_001982 [Variospora sp. 1 TL-2023]